MADPVPLHGFVPAIVTPFSERGEIMEDAFAEILDWLLGNGATAVCVAGDNGESWALSAAERGRLTRLARDRAGGRAAVFTGCSAPTLAASLSYARAAEENGADALLSMPPTYVLKATRAELLRRFEGLAAGCPLPVVLYNSPRRAGFSMSVDDIAAVLDAAPVIGIKESERDFFHHTRLIAALGHRISVMTGPAHFILPAAALGARGFIATGPEFLGPEAGRLMELGRAAPGAEAAALHGKLARLYELLMGTATWPAALKAGLTLLGLPAGVPRDPVCPATEADIAKIRAVLEELALL